MTAANIDTEQTKVDAAELSSRLPNPVGYQILAVKPTIEEKTAGGIIKPPEFLHKESAGAVVALVIKLGDLAYRDEEKFPTGPWCKEGDFILIGAYRGSRFSVDGKEFIILNDDMVLGTVDDPRGVGRAF
jgi:co-chaperonin GroES (HSP10)